MNNFIDYIHPSNEIIPFFFSKSNNDITNFKHYFRDNSSMLNIVHDFIICMPPKKQRKSQIKAQSIFFIKPKNDFKWFCENKCISRIIFFG